MEARTARTAASKSGPNPANHAANIIAQRNEDAKGSVWRYVCIRTAKTSAAVTEKTAIPYLTAVAGPAFHRALYCDILVPPKAAAVLDLPIAREAGRIDYHVRSGETAL